MLAVILATITIVAALRRHLRGERKENGRGSHRFDRVAPTKAGVDFECTLTISGIKYDLSSWANAHPGGAAVLRKFNGRVSVTFFLAAALCFAYFIVPFTYLYTLILFDRMQRTHLQG